MLKRPLQILVLLSLITAGFLSANAQRGADNKSPFGRPEDSEEVPKAVKETREKMRIDKEKKEHDQMLARGEEVLKLSEKLEKSFSQNGRLSDTDRESLESVEKSAKKIRSELGGDDDDETINDVLGKDGNASFAQAVDVLKTSAASLADELKKSTRFTISATAIQSSNAVLTVARFLRVRN
jgi:hypothetical protein